MTDNNERSKTKRDNGRTGKKHTPESIEKMRVARRARTLDPLQEEARIAALKAVVTGVPKSQEHREKIREGMLRFIEAGGNPSMTFMNTKGEQAIAKLLDDMNVEYKTQAVIGGHAYDFLIEKHKQIIEFDGAHHWKAPWFEKDVSKHAALMGAQNLRDSLATLTAEAAGYRVTRIFGVNAPGDSYHGTLEKQFKGSGLADLLSPMSRIGQSMMDDIRRQDRLKRDLGL